MPTHKPAGNANQSLTVIDRHRNSRRHVCRIGFLPGGRSLEQQNLIGSFGDGCPLSTHIDVFIFTKGEANHPKTGTWNKLEQTYVCHEVFSREIYLYLVSDAVIRLFVILKVCWSRKKRIRCLSVDSLVI